MLVHVLYFAATRDLIGRASEQLKLPDGVDTVQSFKRYLQGVHPQLKQRLEAVRFAVNEQFATDDQQLSDGDVVALIPPTAGG